MPAPSLKRIFFATLPPRATLLGLCGQLIGLPLLAFALVSISRLPGDLAVGLMIIAACPGGPLSNIITHLCRGDTALSVTLTAVSSVITVFTIPLLVGFSIRHFPGENGAGMILCLGRKKAA